MVSREPKGVYLAWSGTPRLNDCWYNVLKINSLQYLCEKIAVDLKGVGTPRNPQLEIFVTMLILCVSIRNNMSELSRGVLAKPLDFQPRPPFGLLAPFSVCPALSAALQGRSREQ